MWPNFFDSTLFDSLLLPILQKIWAEAKPVEFAQGLAQATLIWHMVKRSMKEEVEKITKTMETGFAKGSDRFQVIEHDISALKSDVQNLKNNKGG